MASLNRILLDSQKQYFQKIFLRLTRKSGGTEAVPWTLIGGERSPRIYTHNDETVDIAVIPCPPGSDKYQYKLIPVNMITTKEVFTQMNIKEGDEVFFTGLFTPFTGSERNYPIVRFGRVAMIPNERILWKDQMSYLYLIECQSFGGNIDSPVYFHFNALREPELIRFDQPRIHLAGVMIGHFLDFSPIGVGVVDEVEIPFSLENVGIAAVVPAYYLYEILFSEELKKARVDHMSIQYK